MNTLVVVHTEMGYLNPDEVGLRKAQENEQLFDRIARKIGNYIAQGGHVYYLADLSDSPDSELIYPEIRAYSQHMTYVPSDRGLTQPLRTKELLTNDNAQSISIAGVSYGYCVAEIYRILLGEDASAAKTEFERVGRYLRWPAEKFERIFSQRMDARVIDDLTDRS